jgi:hypothetical protein
MLVSCSILFLSASGAQEGGENLLYQQLMEKLESLTPGEDIEVKMGTEKEQYEVGDLFEVRFQTNKDCYVVLMDISSAHKDTYGDITFLLPNSKFPENKIEAGRVYSTLYDFGMNMTVAPPYGLEVINLFCSTEKIDLFEADFEQESFYKIQYDDDERLTALSDRLDQLKQTEWSGNSVKVQIGISRSMPRKHGALPPIGSTGTTGKFFPPIGSTGTTGKQ